MVAKKIVALILLTLFSLFAPASVLSAETLYYIHQDHLGSTLLTTDTTGKNASKQVYFPFGETRKQSLPVGHQTTKRQYTGQVSDTDETGLYYYNARYYNPTIGKFTQADTASDGTNRYAYVRNNPIALVDPSGHQSAFPGKDELPPPPPDETKPGAHRGGGRVPPIGPGADASLSDVAAITSIYLAMLIPIFPPLGPLLEIADTGLCLASGGGPECINPLPGTAASTQIDDVLATATPQFSSDEELFQYLAMQTTEMDTPVSKFDELGDIINKSVPYNSQSASLADEMMDAENGFTNLWNTGCGGICRHRAALLTDAARYQGLDATDLSFKTGKFKPTGDEIRHKVSILTSDSTIYVKDPGLRVDFLDLYLEEKYPNASSFEAYDFTKKKRTPFHPN
ncbi:hypothetical protein A3J20_03395 [Candidatus Gottesmanbacteria bacterium RIFCSPLOWO2_02_FULL_42_29]|uniref:Teneurin-like YD-shell domain-containing protein n=2 Tax=Candidatus Gottesmaniibacteriota TaxID=1752720 RepID=A0A1F6BDM5_9BACT|nr:MAG: YD repeat protein [Candidatus Gottesmanbacteria bacterium GW2011_GWA2_42_18]OGG12221.1 MAG: hypothetical protein A2781_04880 [Candidatus Gottesmanbacteria bacterium RIFCSPHIGHO2_01_FULL_42_27]OGG21709.1 MAG: hypothetical protein A3E72_04545 [Candidatus Gottesmanbacteria bacterium RIFCSPHIGHO2_12_FULL_43_26]OGG34248.1 MAG: hypothetical protein A3G68_03010 [Candidatus Gottesmanbacteria bacterium RIFCSPLOWO2_12_FULL_42_10]OGG35046.1 MAG: hypothetical protein A2968_00245 [Candidatus Gottesm